MRKNKYRVIKGRGVYPGIVEGEAIVTTESISFLGGVNQKTGEIIEFNHPLKGENIAGKIFMFYSGRGSVGSTSTIYYLKLIRKNPSALVMVIPDPPVVFGAILAEIPTIVDVSVEDLKSIKNHSHVRINGESGEIFVYED
ncbi:MAG: DUF126 domain-containing protein [Candidatus Asgardarchaeum sp.]|nr:DUF126 domain-containing protein [Candidatus Odinarchaeota archaeon]